MEHKPLGMSGIEVSALSLGSWRTFERISRGQGVAVMTAAREAGIDFLDDARYDDETSTAPIPTGYSEVVFGELFRVAGWRRDEVVVANKLWWEFWPAQSAAEELDASLGRMGFDHVDLIYAERPPEGLLVDIVVGEVAGLLKAGKARSWGVVNWPAPLIAEAARVAARENVPAPCAAQLPYSLATPHVVEDERMVGALAETGAAVVASYVLAGGALTGKYTSAGGARGRLAGQLDRWSDALSVADELRMLAEDLETSPARLAIAFALANPLVASVLFGATSPDQVAQNVGALQLLARLTGEELSILRRLAVNATA